MASDRQAGDPFAVGAPDVPGRPADTGGQYPLIQRAQNLGSPPLTGEPQEPTTAIGHNVVWYTGNDAVNYSLDGGRTWAGYQTPDTVLAPDPPNLASCCDQQVIYAPKQNLFVWLVQYWCPPAVPPGSPRGTPPTNQCAALPNASNVIRFAVATPEEIRTQARAGNVGKAWHVVMDLTPQQLGEPSGAWFDYSTIAVNDAFVHWTVDVFRGSGSSPKGLAMRINLASLAGYRFQSNYFFSDFHTAAVQVEPGTLQASYFAANHTTSDVRVWEWGANSSTVLIHDIFRSTIADQDLSMNGTDGRDWNARAGGDGLRGRVLSAAWVHNKLIVASLQGRNQCVDKCDTAPEYRAVYPNPGIDLIELNTTDWTKNDLFPSIWSTDTGYSWPNLAVSRGGELGISFVGSKQNANPVAYAAFLSLGGDVFAINVSDPAAGPQPGRVNTATGVVYGGGTGDYYSLEPGPGFDDFVMPYRSVDAIPGGTSDDWHFAIFGLGQLQNPSPPYVFLRAPSDGSSFTEGNPITFAATVSDSADTDIPYDSIYWSVDGTLTSYRGSTVTIPNLDVGEHSVKVTAINSQGLSTSRSVNINVVAAQPNAPFVNITSPTNGDGFTATGDDNQGDFVDVQFAGQASDPQGLPLSYRWDDTATIDGQTAQNLDLSHDLNPVLRLHVGSNCDTATHQVTLTAFNGSQAASSTITVYVASANCVK